MGGIRVVVGILVTIFSPPVLLFISLLTARHMCKLDNVSFVIVWSSKDESGKGSASVSDFGMDVDVPTVA